ncbi:MAG: sigma-54-dependent transcriptional regulator [Planctomycetota bacterium]
MGELRVLIADDDRVICNMIREIVESLGHDVSLAHTAVDTLLAVERDQPDLVLLDLRFPDCADLTTLEGIQTRSPATDVIMVTAEADDLAIVRQATRLGAFDYVPKPIREDDIRIRVTRVSEKRSLAMSHARAMAELTEGRRIGDIIGESPGIRALVHQLEDVTAYDTPVVITGETGTGKELLARALHYGGARRKAPFVSINCAALPRELTESELFGHEKGAFTGAQAARKGAFQEAGSGTIFLDEIGDMSLQAQAALLHVLEHGEYRSVGGRKKQARARIAMATNQDLETLVRDGKFRKDLYFRVNRVRLRVPPLRERKEDIPVLANHFLHVVEAKVGKGIRKVAQNALDALQAYDWPGNVRELRNEMERAHIRSRDGCIGLGDLSPETIASRLVLEANGEEVDAKSLDEIHRLVDALRTSGGNVTRAAKLLDVHRNTLHRWIRKYHLEAL